MFRVNIGLLQNIFVRSLIAILTCLVTISVTGRIADVSLFLGLSETSAAGARTLITLEIFKLILFYGQLYLAIVTLIIISTSIFITLTNKYVTKKTDLIGI